MRILLFNPGRINGYPVVRSTEGAWISKYDTVPVWEFGYFSSIIKHLNSKIEIFHIDANAENLNYKEIYERIKKISPDIIISKSGLSHLREDISPIIDFKKNEDPKVKIILSSNLLTGIEKEILRIYPEIDGIARGELDAFAFDISNMTYVEEIEKIPGIITRKNDYPFARIVKDLNLFPIQDWDIYPKLWGKIYKAPVSLNTSGLTIVSSRGCPFKCKFCTIGGNVFREYNTVRFRDPRNVVREIEILINKFGLNDFLFCSDPIFTYPFHAIPFAKIIKRKKMKINYSCYGHVNVTNAETIKWLSQSGCKFISYGIETFDQKNLEFYDKKINLQRAFRLVRLSRKYGIKTGIFILIGGPYESYRTVFKTIINILKMNPDFVLLNTLTPFPSTLIYGETKKLDLMVSDSFELMDPGRYTIWRSKTGIRSIYLSSEELSFIEKFFKILFYGVFRKNVYEFFFKKVNNKNILRN